ncbi:MAG: ester cyclase [Thermoleophilaceae bacterium]
MTGTAAAVVERLHRELLASRDLAAVDDFFAPAFESHNTPPGLPPGREGVKAFFALFRDGLTDLDVRIDAIVADGDRAAVATTIAGVHSGELFGIPATGRRVEVAGIDIVRVDSDGRIAEHRGLTDTVGLLRQLGAA